MTGPKLNLSAANTSFYHDSSKRDKVAVVLVMVLFIYRMFAYPTRHFQIVRDIQLYMLSFGSVLIN